MGRSSSSPVSASEQHMQPMGVRKGAWTEEEDLLLRKCIDKYGEGNWHRVPARAGLNRCRKSCRLRWLNYLKPNIRRGKFQEDEVDLILRLHKLLGNRWSLIAGRLPGRTANDLKNYWNTHLIKNKNKEKKGLNDPCCHDMMIKNHHHNVYNGYGNGKTKPGYINTVKVNVIKPRPRTFKNFASLRAGNAATTVTSSWPNGCDHINSQSPSMLQPLPASVLEEHTVDKSWWETLLSLDEAAATATGGDGQCGTGTGIGTALDSNSNIKGNIDWSNDIFHDMALGGGCWDLIGANNLLQSPISNE